MGGFNRKNGRDDIMSLMDCYGLRSTESDDFVEMDGCFVDKEILPYLQGLQKLLAQNGFRLRVESAYRSFDRQLSIWNRKARGELPLLSKDGIVMERPKDEENLMYAILTWSALPGCSRHHLGSDIDVVDAQACPEDYEVQLTTEECDTLFAPFHKKLSELIVSDSSFGFERVFVPGRGKIQPEPWHIAHLPTSRRRLENFSISALKNLYEKSEIACKTAILDNLNQRAENYVYPYFV